MTDERAHSDEGADPSNDLRAQNPGATTTADQTRPDETEVDDDDGLGAEDDPFDSDDESSERTKTQDLTQAGRDTDFSEAEE